MVDVSPAYRAAQVADVRRTLARAVVEIISPDVVYGTSTSSGQTAVSQLAQINDKVMDLSHPYVSLEHNRWLLGGGLDLLPIPRQTQGQQGWAANVASLADGTFAEDPWVQLNFTGVTILQACSVVFSQYPLDGLPTDITVAVYAGGSVAWSKRVTDNRQVTVPLYGFTVHTPTAIRVTIHRMDLPGRAPRVAELVAGIYEIWGNDDLVSLAVKQQGDPSCLTLPYGTLTVTMDNSTRRFDPGRKGILFRSLEDRQGLDLSIGVRLADETDEYAPVGRWYQYQGGWKTGNNALSMTWNMVDIVGLLAARTFFLPDPLPTTLLGWVQALVAQLGVNFAGRYQVVAGAQSTPVTADPADLEKINCGDVLRYVCMAAGVWPRADNATGDLIVGAAEDTGGALTLDNLTAYPAIKANADISSIIFTIYEGDGVTTEYIVSGNMPTAAQTVSVQNPFIHTKAQADLASVAILAAYGGNVIQSTGRGDPSAEVGDLDQVETSPGDLVQGRRTYQTLNIQSGVLSGCQSTHLVPAGALNAAE